MERTPQQPETWFTVIIWSGVALIATMWLGFFYVSDVFMTREKMAIHKKAAGY